MSAAEVLALAVPPTITSSATATGTNGSAFGYTITASNSPTGYDATGLPPGLSVNTSTGLISGTPTATGSYSATISAVNACGTGSAPLTITVLPTPPGSPTGLAATSSSAQVALTWNASNGATNYTVWRSLTSGSGYTSLAGGTTTTTGYSDTGVTNGTTYYYIVRAANTGGSSGNSNETSATPSLPISAEETMPPGIVMSGTGANSNVTATVKASVPGHTYQLQFSDSLVSSTWTNIGSPQPGTGSDITLNVPLDTSLVSQRFYRIQIQRL